MRRPAASHGGVRVVGWGEGEAPRRGGKCGVEGAEGARNVVGGRYVEKVAKVKVRACVEEEERHA